MQNVKYKVAGYLRLSKEDGDKEESDSIVSQKSIIENKIKVGRKVLIDGVEAENNISLDSSGKIFNIEIIM